MKKKIIKYLQIIFINMSLCAALTSCLKKDIPKFPLFDGNQIINVYIEYRYNGSSKYNDQPIIAYQRFNVIPNIDTVNSTVNLDITVPTASDSFPDSVRQHVSQSKLWMYVDVSTAATITPIENSTKLGDPVDLTKEQIYQVTAANGNKRTWKIRVKSFTR